MEKIEVELYNYFKWRYNDDKLSRDKWFRLYLNSAYKCKIVEVYNLINSGFLLDARAENYNDLLTEIKSEITILKEAK